MHQELLFLFFFFFFELTVTSISFEYVCVQIVYDSRDSDEWPGLSEVIHECFSPFRFTDSNKFGIASPTKQPDKLVHI